MTFKPPLNTTHYSVFNSDYDYFMRCHKGWFIHSDGAWNRVYIDPFLKYQKLYEIGEYNANSSK